MGGKQLAKANVLLSTCVFRRLFVSGANFKSQAVIPFYFIASLFLWIFENAFISLGKFSLKTPKLTNHTTVSLQSCVTKENCFKKNKKKTFVGVDWMRNNRDRRILNNKCYHNLRSGARSLRGLPHSSLNPSGAKLHEDQQEMLLMVQKVISVSQTPAAPTLQKLSVRWAGLAR